MSNTRVRICDACGTENDFNAFLCKKCNSSIAHIPPSVHAVDKKRSESTLGDSMVKKCPNCGLENNRDDIVCSRCSQPLDIIEAQPKDQIGIVEQDAQNLRNADSSIKDLRSSATVLESLCFISSKDGTAIQCKNGDILGREGTIMKEYFRQYGTVSNIHAKITLNAGLWHVMDLNSSNGTFLNHSRLRPNEEYPLKQNDLLRLSSRLEFIVK